ncbi:MAG TPA: hypothetical protein VKP30_25705, partial [Polyangiaceae bacterium]|nr:hypothetical protein [Polyangiaceae bacterium]
MPHRRLLAKFTFVAVGSSLVGCSGTGFTPGNSDGIAGAAGRNATQAGAAAVNAGTAGASLGGTRATIPFAGTGGNTNPVGGAASTSISGGGTALGIGGSTSMTNVALGGVAGSVNVIPGCETVTCTPSSNPCQEAVCRNGGCVQVNLDAGKPCEASGVCSGTGFCGVCVPSRGKCDNNVPSICSAEGVWVAGSACGLGDECVAGACIAPRVGWALSANGDANAEIEDLAFMGTDSIIAAVHAESGTVNVGSNVLTAESRAHNNAVFGMSRATGAVAWNLTLKSTDWAWGARIGVASDTSFVHGFRYMGSIDIYTNPNTYDYGAFIRGYNAARAVQFTELFNPIDNTAGPQVEGIDAIIAQPNGSFLLFTYSKGLVYSIRDNPGQATIQETSEECATVLSRLNPYGIPVWNKQFAWCTDNNHKVM